MWSWLREVQRPWQEEPFNRALFEDNLDFGDEKIASEWPFNPNKAGKAYLDLVKGEWNSTMTLENVENIENLRVFKGKATTIFAATIFAATILADVFSEKNCYIFDYFLIQTYVA